MKLKRLISILFVISLISVACEKDAKNALLPGFEQKLVVTSFLCPADSISFIGVTLNRPVYGELQPYQSPGIVSGWISDGEKEIRMTTTDSGLVFTKNEMTILNNKTYSIIISNENGLSSSAKCTIPDKFDFEITIDTFSVVHESIDEWDNEYREQFVSVKFKDNPAKENFYHLIGEIDGFYPYGDTVILFKEFIRFEKDIFTDRERNADGFISFNGPFQDICCPGTPISYIFRIYLLDTEESYYLYHKSIFDYKDDDNPFTEPTPVYSNIEGGLGIFTSYALDSAVFRLN